MCHWIGLWWMEMITFATLAASLLLHWCMANLFWHEALSLVLLRLSCCNIEVTHKKLCATKEGLVEIYSSLPVWSIAVIMVRLHVAVASTWPQVWLASHQEAQNLTTLTNMSSFAVILLNCSEVCPSDGSIH